MCIILGLGNYGDKYAYTYHNLGFLTAECICDKLGMSFKTKECDSLVATGYINSKKVIVAKPLTYMNLSGKAALQLIKKNKMDVSDLIVIYDDIDIERGSVRVREKGSGGTHNGMRNIIELLGSQDFRRIRIGVGKPEGQINLADYVLSDIPKNDKQLFFDAINKAADEAVKMIKET